MDLLKKLAFFFTKKERVLAIGLLGMMFLGGVSEAVGIGLLVPYLSLINDSSLITKNKYLSSIYGLYPFGGAENFIFWCGIGFFVLFLLKNLYGYLLLKFQNAFIYKKEVSLSRSLLEAYLRQPYTFHLQKNSAELITNLNHTIHVFQGVVLPLLTVIIEVVTSASIIAILLTVKTGPTLISAAAIGLAALIYYIVFRTKIKEVGVERNQYAENMMRWLNQGLGGIKETKILGREDFFIGGYSKNLSGYVECTGFVTVASQLPKLLLEVLSVLGIVVTVCYTILKGENIHALIPALSLFGVAAIRITPSLNKILANLAVVRSFKDSVDIVYRDLREFPELITDKSGTSNQVISKKGLSDSIEIKNLKYRYPQGSTFAIDDISLKIPKGSSAAFIGTSGAGKSTLVDIILGLLDPTSGQVLIDDVDIKNVREKWQRSVGYIPQSIFLTDDSIRGNVAFGVRESEIDDSRVWAALRAAQLEDFVKGLPRQLETFVGERGVRISGGQRQRIGIARALYQDPEVLILDEATSALDNDTEREVSQAIQGLSGKKTMIVIAHRLSTAEKCDQIIKFGQGKIISKGSYAEVCLGEL